MRKEEVVENERRAASFRRYAVPASKSQSQACPHEAARQALGACVQNTKASLPKCRGFLVSCWSGKEQQAAREAIEILEEVLILFLDVCGSLHLGPLGTWKHSAGNASDVNIVSVAVS